MTLLFTDDLARTFLGALLSVCRIDGEVNGYEFEALRKVGEEVAQGVHFDHESLLFSQVTPRALAEALGQGEGQGPFRESGTSSADAIALAFVHAALRVARADGELNEGEVRVICAFARALGKSTSDLYDLDAALDEARHASDL